MNDFTKHCYNKNSNLNSFLEKYFNLLQRSLMYPSEFSLGFYLYHHLAELFPEASEVILYESPLIGNRSDLGTADFICRTRDDKIMLIELKFIDLEASGKTAQKRRNKKRQKVLQQVLHWKRTIMRFYDVSEDQILCRIFTTDYLSVMRSQSAGVPGKYVDISELRKWLSSIHKVIM